MKEELSESGSRESFEQETSPISISKEMNSFFISGTFEWFAKYTQLNFCTCPEIEKIQIRGKPRVLLHEENNRLIALIA